ncbi:MAG: 50S ribosomal protein L21 [Gammaproteobacteria bacterium]|nr:50S ribosomal protein L21 [Gammaproteobacteria bacterium]MCG3144055.1 50S ribosomal protein L21 [Gammaproteobacteria bacterium]
MYAVIRTGGKQYKVAQGDTLDVEKLPAEQGANVELSDVLMLVDGDKVTVGTPTVAGAKVSAKIVEHGRGEKIRIIKFRRRKHYRKQAGHRQDYTRLEITGISA